MIKTYIIPAFVYASFAVSSNAFAGEQPSTVVELFTSQGCSSCPPANEFVGGLADDDDKLVLSYGVTYWDYLGWEDTFGDPKYTLRQKEYDASFEIGHVYTPQIVLNGAQHNSRYKASDIKELKPLTPQETHVDIEDRDGRLSISSNADQVYLVRFTPGWQKVSVKRGENGGRTLKVANVVNSLELVDEFGITDIEIDKTQAYAALVHDPQSHEIIAASVLRP